MNLINLQKSKKYAILIIVITIVIITSVLTIGILSTKKAPEQNSADRQLQTLIARLPYLTKEFGIRYSQDKKQLYINVFLPPYEQNRQKALTWIKSQGIDTQKLNITYTPKNKFKQ